jgi:sialate O-acetylesterase
LVSAELFDRTAASHPRIRHIKFAHRPSADPLTDVPSSGWQACSPKTVGGFTGVGYFFGRELQGELDVPVGLIGCNWGGTRIEPWTPPVGFKETPGLSDIADKLDEFPTRNNQGKVNHQSPLALYNGMVHSIVPYGMRGGIWYQGESNNGEGMLYHEKMKALIHGWRKVWDNDSMPFGFVQLAPYTYGGDPTRLAGIWEAQTATLKVPHTGMAVTVDVANLKDIHPRNKQDVGRRLALWALSESYGQRGIVYSGPIYKSMKVEGGRIRVSFDHVGSGLVSRDDKPLNWFTIAGDDGKFVEATATIDGQDVLVTAESVAKPTAVRFGWSQLAEPNLSNKEGLPASPFRTDSNYKHEAQARKRVDLDGMSNIEQGISNIEVVGSKKTAPNSNCRETRGLRHGTHQVLRTRRGLRRSLGNLHRQRNRCALVTISNLSETPLPATSRDLPPAS